jgi:hypothetical protein
MPLEPEELPATPEQRRAKAAAHPGWRATTSMPPALKTRCPQRPANSCRWKKSTKSPRPCNTQDTAAEEIDSSHAELLAEQQASTVPALAQGDAERLLMSLRSGHWVDLYSRRRWLRAQLIWASTRARCSCS